MQLPKLLPALLIALAWIHPFAGATPISLLRVTGDPGDPVTLGQSFTFTPDSGLFSPCRHYDRASGIIFSSPRHYWTVDLAAPYEGRLTPGRYDNLPRYPFQSPNQWALSVTGDGRYCLGALSNFAIAQVRYDSTGAVTLLQATFEQHCDARPAGLYGMVVFNADTSLYVVSPQDVYAFTSDSVGFDATATDAEGKAVNLSAAGLPPGATFVDQGDGTGRFTWPGGSPTPGTFVITVTAEDAVGRTASSATFVRVHGPDFIRLDPDSGDYVTQSRHYFFNDANATLSIWANSLWAASARALTPEDDFQLAFAAPYPRPLAAGHYVAQSAPAGEYPSALSLDGDHRACGVATGWFDVRQVVFGGAGQTLRLWVVFEDHCEGAAPAVRGEVRINADTTIYVLPPADVYVMAGTETTLTISGRDTRGNPVVLTATGVPDGCSFLDLGSGVGELRLTQALAAIGDYPIVFTCANALGGQSSATTYLHVRVRPAAVPLPERRMAVDLEWARPNPTAGPVIVSFALPDNGSAQLELVDVAGRAIVSREVGTLGPGIHEVRLAEAHSLRAGFYWIRLRCGDRRLTRGVIVLR